MFGSTTMKKKLLYIFTIIVFITSPYFVYAKTSNDPFVSQWSYEDLGVFDAWNYSVGSSDIVVAIIDNGFDTFHPDLRSNVWKNKGEIANNGLDDDKNGYIDDVYGWNFLDDNNDPRPAISGLSQEEINDGVFNHGTVVAGIIGAKGNNKRDGAGINWNVKLMNLKVLGNSGNGSILPLIDAIYYAVDNGADVISISMVGSTDDGVSEAVDYAYNKGVVVVAAAGNNNIALNYSPCYPVCSDMNSDIEMVFGVSAIDEDHYNTKFTNSGSKCINITAPGVDIYSTIRFSPKDNLLETYSGGWTGTSFATPFISGTAALIKSIQPTWGPDEIFKAMVATVHHTPNDDEELYADLFGAGLIQIDKAVKYAFDKKSESKTGLDYSKKMMVVSLQTGQYELRNGGKDNTTVKKRAILGGIGNLKGVVNSDDELIYVTSRKIEESTERISVYDKNFKRLKYWDIKTGKFWDISVGDVSGDGELEVVVTHEKNDLGFVSVYGLNGNLIKELELVTDGNGMSSALVYDEIRQAYDLALVFMLDGSLIFKRFDGSGLNEENYFSVPKFKHLPSVETGDVDGDGVDEYVMSAGLGDLPRIISFEQDGTFINSFNSYSLRYRDGVNVSLFDYDDDGVEEIVTSPMSFGQPVRAFNNNGYRSEGWWALGRQDVGQIVIIPLL